MLTGIVVGCGYISERHLTAWSRIRSVRISALVDLNLARARARARQFSVPAVYDDFGQALALERPQFVDLITRPDTHRPLVRQAVSAGCHVLCQKPFAPSLDEADAMIRAAQAAGVRIMVAEMWRWLPVFRQVKSLLARNVAGVIHACHLHGSKQAMPRSAPVSATQPYFKDMPRLITYEMGIHYIDVMRCLFGDVDSVYAVHRKVNPILAGEDLAIVTMRHADGPVSLLDYNWASPPDDRSPHVRIEGEDGTIEVLSDQQTLWVRPNQAPDREHAYVRPANAMDEAFADCLGHFAECIESGQPFATGAEDNVRTLAATLACYESAQKGQAVAVP